MASTRICWQCLLRPPCQIRQFSSSSCAGILYGKKKSPFLSGSGRPGSAQKKGSRRSDKPTEAGERKAVRKRVSISNISALEVENLQSLTGQDVKGQVVVIPQPVVEKLRALGAFKPTQGWGLFRRQALLLREEGCELASRVFESQSSLRRVYVGDRWTGKSTILVHAMAAALLKGWVVINIPECNDLVVNNTAYSPIPDSHPVEYSQKQYMALLCRQIAKANEEVLSKFSISRQHDVPIPIASNMSLSRLAALGAEDPDIAWPIFKALWTELTTDGKSPPILIAIDGLGSIMGETGYRDKDYNKIHAHDLALVKHLIAYFSKDKSLPNGGMILAATSGSTRPSNPTLDLALKSAENRTESKSGSPFLKYDQRVLEALKDVEAVRLKGLDKDETRTIMEYYAASGLIEPVTEHSLIDQWVTASRGIVGELEKGALYTRH